MSVHLSWAAANPGLSSVKIAESVEILRYKSLMKLSIEVWGDGRISKVLALSTAWEVVAKDKPKSGKSTCEQFWDLQRGLGSKRQWTWNEISAPTLHTPTIMWRLWPRRRIIPDPRRSKNSAWSQWGGVCRSRNHRYVQLVLLPSQITLLQNGSRSAA